MKRHIQAGEKFAYFEIIFLIDMIQFIQLIHDMLQIFMKEFF